MIKIEPHFLAEILRFAAEAREDANAFLLSDESDDVELHEEAVKFLMQTIALHSNSIVADWFEGELRRLEVCDERVV